MSCLPFRPGAPSIPLTPGTPALPLLPVSPRDVQWKDVHPSGVLGRDRGLNCDSSLTCVCKIVLPVCTAIKTWHRVRV